MRFVFGKQDMVRLSHCWLLANGLGGYMSASAAFSVTRCDQGLLVAAVTAPSVRVTTVQRLSEELTVGEETHFLSTQTFAGGQPPEEGYKNLSSFVWDDGPSWLYHVSGVQVRRRCAMEYGANTAAVVYDIENRSDAPCALAVRPVCLFAPKGETAKTAPAWSGCALHGGGMDLPVYTNGTVLPTAALWETPRLPGRRQRRPDRGGPRRLLLLSLIHI